VTGARLLPPPAEVGRRALDLWADARLAARLLAADPHGLGGAVLRASPGPPGSAPPPPPGGVS